MIPDYGQRSEFALQHLNAGMLEGVAQAVLLVLMQRGITLTDEAHDRLIGCTDVDQLKTWICRAVSARELSDVFD